MSIQEIASCTLNKVTEKITNDSTKSIKIEVSSIFLILFLFLTFLLVGVWLIQALNEKCENEIKFKNIHELIEYHYKYLLKFYTSQSNDNSKNLHKKLNEPRSEDFNIIAEKLDDLIYHYNNIGKYIESRNLCLTALNLRKWNLPDKHVDITKNMDDLMKIHSNLCDYDAARRVFEHQMEKRNYRKFLINY